MMSEPRATDLIIVGGGPAGMTAALYAGRARRSVLVLDEGAPRHAPSPAVHNYLTQDGTTPARLREIAWEQMAAYPNVKRRTARVERLHRDGGLWVADCGPQGQVRGRAVLLAVGTQDVLPRWPGLTEKWGKSVHFCPYCHGWEMRDRPLAAFGHGEAIAHFGPLLQQWSRDVVVVTGGTPLSDEARAVLEHNSIPVRDASIVALEGPGSTLTGMRLSDGTHLARQGLFLATPQRQAPLVRALGLETEPSPFNEDGFVVVDEMQKTSAPMLWAAGDLTTPFHQVVFASAAGAKAAVAINMALVAGAV